jgi:hypothetical protein
MLTILRFDYCSDPGLNSHELLSLASIDGLKEVAFRSFNRVTGLIDLTCPFVELSAGVLRLVHETVILGISSTNQEIMFFKLFIKLMKLDMRESFIACGSWLTKF